MEKYDLLWQPLKRKKPKVEEEEDEVPEVYPHLMIGFCLLCKMKALYLQLVIRQLKSEMNRQDCCLPYKANIHQTMDDVFIYATER